MQRTYAIRARFFVVEAAWAVPASGHAGGAELAPIVSGAARFIGDAIPRTWRRNAIFVAFALLLSPIIYLICNEPGFPSNIGLAIADSDNKGKIMSRKSRSFGPLFSVVLAAVFVCLTSLTAYAQPTGMSAKPVLRTNLSGDDSKETVMLTVEFAPGGTTGLHIHNGDEYTFVMQGTLELTAEGRETRRVTAGDAYHNPRGLVHQAKNVGDTSAIVKITFVIEKGKPITEAVHK
jgi:quercetin dioxygenase-like cupin family protein